MPTGYTAELSETPDMSFEAFAWKCARAMGVCIMQRDDSASTPIAMEETPCDYYAESLSAAEKDLIELRSMDTEEVRKCCRDAMTERIAHGNRCK